MKYNYYDLIRKPIINEKSTMLGEQGKYTFEVACSASKSSIKSAIEAIFEVKVSKVNVLNKIGKVKRFKGKLGKQINTKRAIVTLEKDFNIDLLGGGK